MTKHDFIIVITPLCIVRMPSSTTRYSELVKGHTPLYAFSDLIHCQGSDNKLIRQLLFFTLEMIWAFVVNRIILYITYF